MKNYQEILSMKRTIENHIRMLDEDASAILENKQSKLGKYKRIVAHLDMILENFALLQFVFSDKNTNFNEILKWQYDGQ